LEHFRKSLELQPPRSGARDKVARRVKLCEEQLALHQKLPRILDGTLQAKDAAEQLGLAQLCLRYTKQYRAAAGFFAAAFDKNPQLGNPLQYKHCYDGACAAARAASGTGADAAQLDDQQRAALRRQALAWLNANLAVWKTEMDRGNVAAILQAQDRVLPLWQEDTALAALRDEPDLARLSKEEQQGCRQFWSAVQQALVQARSHFIESTRSGSLTAEMREAHHPWKMTAGKTYVIDLKSTEFDTFLRLHDEHGVKLAENDDVDPGRDTNSRLIFTPKQDGTYQIIATSFERQEYGAYEIVVREFRKRAQ
jgi:hypothetical protein